MALKSDIKGIKLDSIPKWARVLIVIIIPIIVGAAYYVLYFQQTQEKIAGLETQVQNVQKEIAKNETKARRLGVLKEQNEWLKQRLEELKGQLPKESEITELLRKVSEKGTGAGLEIVKWRPGPRRPNPSGLYDEIPVDVEVLGGYHDLGMFFNGITQLTRIVNISDIQISPGAKAKTGKGSQSKLADRKDLLKVEFKATTFAVSTAPPPEQQKAGAKGTRR